MEDVHEYLPTATTGPINGHKANVNQPQKDCASQRTPCCFVAEMTSFIAKSINLRVGLVRTQSALLPIFGPLESDTLEPSS